MAASDLEGIVPRDRLAVLREIASQTVIEDTHDTMRAPWQHLGDTNAVYGGGGRKTYEAAEAGSADRRPAWSSAHGVLTKDEQRWRCSTPKP